MVKEDIRVSIGLKRSTKARLDNSRAPGQCYDGFVCQLIEMWNEAQKKRGIEKTH
ncbi:MAG: hypothetical protein PHT28_02775 [Dehalococcoidales bacterium]|nr:hypothetical protein [Dehalococcoidales bacterium]MDD4230496.1 hypothetical protein [Dehalococcoidales bacterium]MDD4465335.1 hypothetical protein [Dehalococcoidales bacterium]MDD5402363.1 hypothetical protein [Dehalococcoidales bacterium]